MKIIKIEDDYVLGFATEAEAQAVLDETLKSNKDAKIHESLSDYINRIVHHLQLRGIDATVPVPAPAQEVGLPEGTSSSYAVETIVPTKTPTAFVPVPRGGQIAPSGPGTDEGIVVKDEGENTPTLPAPVVDTWSKEKN